MTEWRDLLRPEVLAALERFRASQFEPESLPEAINGILTDWLSVEGHLPPEDLPDGDE